MRPTLNCPHSVDKCKLDACKSYIPENNIPFGFDVDGETGDVYVAVPRTRTGVYSTLNKFNIRDIKKGQCPPLEPYPAFELNALDSDCCGDPFRITNVFRVKIVVTKHSKRLFFIDIGQLLLNDKDFEIKSPYLYAIDLNTNQIILRKPIPSDLINNNGRGLLTPSIDVVGDNDQDTYVYITDQQNGLLLVYSQAIDAFYRFKSPYFYADGPQGDKVVHSPVTYDPLQYFVHGHVSESTIDRVNQVLYLFSFASLHVIKVPLAILNNINKAGCSPDLLNVTLVGDLPAKYNGYAVTLYDPKEVIFGLAEQRKSIYCFSDTIGPQNAFAILKSSKLLPFPVDIQGEAIDLQYYFKNAYYNRDYHRGYGQYRRNYNKQSYQKAQDTTFILSNNYQSIKQEGFNPHFPNFVFSYFDVDEILHKYPQCNPKTLGKGYSRYSPAPAPKRYEPKYQPKYQSRYRAHPISDPAALEIEEEVIEEEVQDVEGNVENNAEIPAVPGALGESYPYDNDDLEEEELYEEEVDE